jgi:hypothetical protein
MPGMDNILAHYDFTSLDEEQRAQLADIILPLQAQFAEDFCGQYRR